MALEDHIPKRACILTIMLEADSKDDMLRALDATYQALARDELTHGVWGGSHHSAVYDYVQREHPTHDEYVLHLKEWLAKERKSPV
jgi:hypothetical protein